MATCVVWGVTPVNVGNQSRSLLRGYEYEDELVSRDQPREFVEVWVETPGNEIKNWFFANNQFVVVFRTLTEFLQAPLIKEQFEQLWDYVKERYPKHEYWIEETHYQKLVAQRPYCETVLASVVVVKYHVDVAINMSNKWNVFQRIQMDWSASNVDAPSVIEEQSERIVRWFDADGHIRYDDGSDGVDIEGVDYPDTPTSGADRSEPDVYMCELITESPPITLYTYKDEETVEAEDYGLFPQYTPNNKQLLKGEWVLTVDNGRLIKASTRAPYSGEGGVHALTEDLFNSFKTEFGPDSTIYVITDDSAHTRQRHGLSIRHEIVDIRNLGDKRVLARTYPGWELGETTGATLSDVIPLEGEVYIEHCLFNSIRERLSFVQTSATFVVFDVIYDRHISNNTLRFNIIKTRKDGVEVRREDRTKIILDHSGKHHQVKTVDDVSKYLDSFACVNVDNEVYAAVKDTMGLVDHLHLFSIVISNNAETVADYLSDVEDMMEEEAIENSPDALQKLQEDIIVGVVRNYTEDGRYIVYDADRLITDEREERKRRDPIYYTQMRKDLELHQDGDRWYLTKAGGTKALVWSLQVRVEAVDAIKIGLTNIAKEKGTMLSSHDDATERASLIEELEIDNTTDRFFIVQFPQYVSSDQATKCIRFTSDVHPLMKWTPATFLFDDAFTAVSEHHHLNLWIEDDFPLTAKARKAASKFGSIIQVVGTRPTRTPFEVTEAISVQQQNLRRECAPEENTFDSHLFHKFEGGRMVVYGPNGFLTQKRRDVTLYKVGDTWTCVNASGQQKTSTVMEETLVGMVVARAVVWVCDPKEPLTSELIDYRKRFVFFAHPFTFNMEVTSEQVQEQQALKDKFEIKARNDTPDEYRPTFINDHRVRVYVQAVKELIRTDLSKAIAYAIDPGFVYPSTMVRVARKISARHKATTGKEFRKVGDYLGRIGERSRANTERGTIFQRRSAAKEHRDAALAAFVLKDDTDPVVWTQKMETLVKAQEAYLRLQQQVIDQGQGVAFIAMDESDTNIRAVIARIDNYRGQLQHLVDPMERQQCQYALREQVRLFTAYGEGLSEDIFAILALYYKDGEATLEGAKRRLADYEAFVACGKRNHITTFHVRMDGFEQVLQTVRAYMMEPTASNYDLVATRYALWMENPKSRESLIRQSSMMKRLLAGVVLFLSAAGREHGRKFSTKIVLRLIRNSTGKEPRDFAREYGPPRNFSRTPMNQ